MADKAKAQQKDAGKPVESEPAVLETEEVKEVVMDVDEFYPDGHIDKPLEDSNISKRNKRFFGCQGVQSYKRYNIHYLEDNVIIFATGNTYQIYNIQTHEKKIFHGQDSDGIGSIAVHPSRKYYAVAEKGKFPNIYIYEYPSMRLYRILRRGTEQMYAHIEFSVSGTKLASVGGNPDYTITVWDWLSQRVILKAKAFSQDVYRVSFSPFTDDILFTSGSGHIRFWRMAQTFTGLKLQGEIGKFGALELSDVTGFAELPDGKVICGSEQGNLILWEGNLVKAHLVLDKDLKTSLHNDKMIEVVYLDGEHVITAGGDGYIKWWKFTEIDNAEADETIEVAIHPVKEKIIRDEQNGGEPAYIVNMIKGNDHWLIQDGKGKIWKMMMDTMAVTEIKHFHSGKISDLTLSPTQNAAVTLGKDGQAKLWDFIRDREFYSRKFEGKGTCLDALPYSEANQGKVVAAGFSNGIVRILMLGSHDFQILKSFKAHDSSVVRVKYAPDNTMFATASKNGEIFFFIISGQDNLQKYEPLCMVLIPVEEGETVKINDMRWDSDSNHLLVGCSNGYVYEIDRPRAQDIDNTETFLTDAVRIRPWRIKMMEFQMKKNQKKDEEEEEKKRRMRLRGELPKEEEEQEEDWDPEPIIACNYLNDGHRRFIVASQGQFSGYVYICDFNQARPIKALEVPKSTLCRFIDRSPSEQFLILGFENGEIQIRYMDNPEKLLQIKMHDGHRGRITSVKFDKEEKILISTGEDGLIYIHLIDKENMKKEATYNPLEGVEGVDYMAESQREEIRQQNLKEFFDANPPYFTEIDYEKDSLDHAYLAQSLKLTDDVNEDVLDPTQYSIQQAKLRTEEDHRVKLAEEKKEGVKMRIEKLRKAFKELRVRNSSTEEWIQITEDDFNIDPVYFNMLRDRNDLKIEEARKEVAWNIEFHTAKLNKLKSKFYDILEFEKFTVVALKTNAYVTTFRVHKMSDFLQQNIETFKQMLESEMLGNNSLDFNDDADMDNLDASGNLQTNSKDDKNKDAAQTKTSMNQTKKQQQQQAQLQAKKTEAEKKREERKHQREARKKKIEKLEKKEAMHSGEDPADRKEIEEAMQTYKDYKLKQSSSYIVPENQRVNFSKKRQQMVLLEGSIHKLKVDFNQKIQELKIRKQEIIERVKKLNGRLGDIHNELGEGVQLFEPTINETIEYPEKFFEIQDKDIEIYRKAKAEKERLAAASKNKSNFGSKKQQQTQVDDTQAQANTGPVLTEEQKQAEAKLLQEKAVEDKKRSQGIERKGKKGADLSEIDNEQLQIRRIELQYEKDQLNAEIDNMINTFDEEIKEMQKEKYRLESDLKNAETKLVLFFEELILLKSMEGRDQELTKALAKCRQDKGQILREINDISKKLREKKNDIDGIKAREEDLMSKFHELCPEGSDKYDEIRKFFEKIIKRRPKQRMQDKEQDGDEDDDDAGADEEEEYEEDEEDEEDENNVVSLPQEEYKIDEIEKLRDERMNLYDEKEKILQFINELESQRKKLENNEKKIKAELEDTEEEIQDFQKEKMAKLNQLDVSVVLKVKQLQNLEPDYNLIEKWRQIREKELETKQLELQQHHDGDSGLEEQQKLQQLMEEEDYRGYFLPKDLKDSVLFTRTQLLQLINRKRELDEEQINLDKQFKEYKRDHNQKKKEIKENEKIRAAKEREYNERQMLRFGNLVDLDNLEISGPSNAVLELQNKFGKTEKRCIKMIEEADSEMEKTQRDLTQAIKNNTNLLNLIRQLGEEQLQLNRNLDSTNKAIFVDEDDEDKKNMMEEKQKLKKLLELQAKEVETLKTEINLYKKKGGHIYTKVTTNRRVASLNNQE